MHALQVLDQVGDHHGPRRVVQEHHLVQERVPGHDRLVQLVDPLRLGPVAQHPITAQLGVPLGEVRRDQHMGVRVGCSELVDREAVHGVRRHDEGHGPSRSSSVFNSASRALGEWTSSRPSPRRITVMQR